MRGSRLPKRRARRTSVAQSDRWWPLRTAPAGHLLSHGLPHSSRLRPLRDGDDSGGPRVPLCREHRRAGHAARRHRRLVYAGLNDASERTHPGDRDLRIAAHVAPRRRVLPTTHVNNQRRTTWESSIWKRRSVTGLTPARVRSGPEPAVRGGRAMAGRQAASRAAR